MDEDVMESIGNGLFPTHPTMNRDYHDVRIPETILFTKDELMKAIGSLKNNKAPGLDGVPSEVLKIITEVCPQLLLRMYNSCLLTGVFSKQWKRARLVLLDKGKGEPNLPSSWRPLCMLDTAGKGYEKLLQLRLVPAVEEAGDLSARQYGFRKGRSTVDALLDVVTSLKRTQEGSRYTRNVAILVTLDVKNAFNSARWSDILEALEGTFHVPPYLLRVMGNYLKDRNLVYETAQGQRVKEITAGAAQGSILGPQLWNVAYDGVLRLEMPTDCFLVGYADDVAAVIQARTIELAQVKLDVIMRRITRWMDEHGLTLATSKTEVVLFTRKRIPTIIPIQVGGTEVWTKPAAKYLGIMLTPRSPSGSGLNRLQIERPREQRRLAG
uniref:Reverse transcriptase domain-containing protein n=1 Tax=Lygus hesperus TaxID=30085 RepID=A0A0K8SB34_LYGHE